MLHNFWDTNICFGIICLQKQFRDMLSHVDTVIAGWMDGELTVASQCKN